jgi:hypothetical protein
MAAVHTKKTLTYLLRGSNEQLKDRMQGYTS